MKNHEFQVGQPVFPSPDGTEPKDGERSRSPSSIQMTVKVVIWNIIRTDSVCTHQTGQNIVQSIWSTTIRKRSRTVFVISQARNEKSEIDLVFLVPEKEKTLVLYASSGAMPKVYTVKIDVP